MEQAVEDKEKQALTIVRGLVIPEYTINYQPTYSDQDALISAVSELLETTPATTPEQIVSFRDELAHIGLANGHSRLDIVGSCHEEVKLRVPEMDIKELVDPIIIEHGVVLESDPDALHAQRTAGQSVKPRSNEFEELSDGERVLSFFGEGVNDSGYTQRNPDPSRMVSMALQARDITETVQESLGEHIPIAHEMLLLAYEEAFVRIDENTGKKYLLSADLPWIGVRTNDPDGPHVELLSKVDNAVGVKIGPNSDATHIKRLAEKLNPNDELGKLVFMLRIGDDVIKTLEILEAIQLYAPTTLILFDIHAVTKPNKDGIKVRCVQDVISQARLLHKLCRGVGLAFHGHHLETTTEDRYECVDTPDELPKHPGKVDPRLNSRQLRHVLTEV